MNTPRVALLLLAAFPCIASAQVTLFDEDFAAGARLTYAAGTSAQWFSSAASGNVVYTAGTSVQQNGAGRHLIGYFRADGDPVTIANAGDTLTLTFTITLNKATGALGDAQSNLRIGLYNSNDGTRVSADSHGGTGTGTVFDNVSGYAAMINAGITQTTTTNNAGARIMERTTMTNALIGSTGGYTTLVNTPQTQALEKGIAYTGTLSLTRTALDHLDLTYSLTGGTLSNYSISTTDTTSPIFSFDTMAFYLLSSTADSFTLTSASILYTSAVPEPSTFAALAGALALGFVTWRRRKI